MFSSAINAFHFCFFVSVAFLWNTIPEDILARSQVKHFRSRLKQFILMRLFNSVLVLCMLFCFCNCIFVTVKIVSNQKQPSCKKRCGPQKGHGEKRCEIQGGGQEMAVMVG